MVILEIFQAEYVSIIAGGFSGVVTAWITQRVLNKRGIFGYSVTHNRIGITAEDAIFGNVAVSWNNQQVQNLYLSTIEMKNESMNDYENVIVHAYTSDTKLMTEQTQLVDTPNILEWSEKYKEYLHVEPNGYLSESQWIKYNGEREYIIPVFNRGQSIKITYLNSANTDETPCIWLSVSKRGVKLKFRGPQNQILGVPQNQASFAGVVLGILVLIVIVTFISNLWIVATIGMVYGLVAQLPGACAIKVIQRLRDAIGG